MKILEQRFGLSSRQIERIVSTYEEQSANGELYPSLTPANRQAKGPPTDLTADMAGCIVEFNSMDGYRLPIRLFTVRFNETYQTSFSVSTMHRYVKMLGSILRSTAIKPSLTEIIDSMTINSEEYLYQMENILDNQRENVLASRFSDLYST